MKNFSLKTKESSLRNYRVRRIGRVVMWSFVALLGVYFFGNLLQGVTSTATKFIFSVENYFAQSGAALPVYIRDRNELLKSLAEKDGLLSAHDGDAATIAKLEGENAELRMLLGADGEPRIAAGVIARPPRVPYDILYLDQGSTDGIQVGAVVYYADDHAIGFVSRVFDHSALVTLFSTPGVESTVYVFGPNVYTTAHGEGGGVVRVPIPQGITVTEGDVVVIPSIESGTLGTIGYVISNPTEPEQNAYLTFTAPLQSLYRVSVSSRSIEPISFEEAQTRVEEIQKERFVLDVPELFMFTSGTSTVSTSSVPGLVPHSTTSSTTAR